ncbi:hypothetical protein GCM10025776_30990 [Corallincola platygyrae]
MARLMRALHWWHRKLGLAAAIFIFVLSLTGIALNHTDGLRLSERTLTWGWLLNWYGIETPQVDAFAVGPDWLLSRDQQLYLNTQRVTSFDGDVVGAVVWQQMLVVATSKQLLLVTEEGELAEKVNHELGWPRGVNAIGVTPSEALMVKHDDQWLQADEALLTWSAPVSLVPANSLTWSVAGEAPAALVAQLPSEQHIDLERVVLDLHSGRLFGIAGVWMMDLAAIAMMLLAASGIWMWAKRRRGNRAIRTKRS